VTWAHHRGRGEAHPRPRDASHVRRVIAPSGRARPRGLQAPRPCAARPRWTPAPMCSQTCSGKPRPRSAVSYTRWSNR